MRGLASPNHERDPGDGRRITGAPRGPGRLRLAAALSFLVLLGSGVAWATYQDFTDARPARLPRAAAGAPGSRISTARTRTSCWSAATAAPARPRPNSNALHTVADGGTVNTDTMMVLHVPADGSRPTIVSFPRDSWVEHPRPRQGQAQLRVPDGYNAAQHAGQSAREAQSAGIVLTIQTLEQLTGLHIDHYVQVNLLGFYRISEAIGGVPVCLLHAQNAHTDTDADGSGYSGIDLPAGRIGDQGRPGAGVRPAAARPAATATSTGSGASSTSCPRRSARSRRPACCSTRSSCTTCCTRCSSSLLTDSGAGPALARAPVRGLVGRQDQLRHRAEQRAAAHLSRTASRPRSSRSTRRPSRRSSRRSRGQPARLAEVGRTGPRAPRRSPWTCSTAPTPPRLATRNADQLHRARASTSTPSTPPTPTTTHGDRVPAGAAGRRQGVAAVVPGAARAADHRRPTRHAVLGSRRPSGAWPAIRRDHIRPPPATASAPSGARRHCPGQHWLAASTERLTEHRSAVG